MRWYHFLLLAFFIGVTSSLVIINPQFLRWPEMNAELKSQPALRPSKLFQNIPENFKSVLSSNYRYGENRNGEVVGTLKPSGLQIAWQVSPLNVGLHTASKSSPAVDDSGIYVGSDSGWFFKYSNDGQEVWRYYTAGNQYGVHASASLDQGRVYFGAYNGFLYALNKETGKPIWSVNLGDAIGSSTLLHKEYLYVGVETMMPSNGYLAKVRARDGKIMFLTHYLGEQPHCSPVVDEASQTVIIGANSDYVFGFDLETGKQKWKSAKLGDIKGTLALWNNRVWFGTWDEYFYSLNPRNGKIESKLKLQGRAMSSAAIDTKHGVAVVGAGIRNFGIDLRENKILWTKEIYKSRRDSPLALMKMSSTVVTDGHGKTFALTLCDENVLCSIDPRSGKEISQVKLPANLSNTPVVYKDRVFLSLDDTGGLMVLKNH